MGLKCEKCGRAVLNLMAHVCNKSGGTLEGPRAERQEERESTQRPYASKTAHVKNRKVVAPGGGSLGRDTSNSISGTTVQEPSVDSRSVVKADGRATKPGGIKSTPPVSKRGRPRIGESPTQPWIAAGMSERTWYRRQKEQKK